MSDQGGSCRKEKGEKNDDEVRENDSLGQSQPHPERPIHPTEKNLSEKVTQGESEDVTHDQDQGENEGKAHHGKVGRIRHVAFEACRQMGLEMTPKKNPQHNACKRGDLPEKSSKDSLHQEKDHRADDKDIQDIHGAMFIRASKSPSRTESVDEICLPGRFHPKKNIDETYILWHK